MSGGGGDKRVLVNGNTGGNDIISNRDGGQDTCDDANNTSDGRVEDWNSLGKNGVTLGTEEAPKSSYGIDGVVVELVGLPLELEPGDGVVKIRPVEASIEDASLGWVHWGSIA